MAHKIFGQRFISRSQPAWHNLGLIFSEDEDIAPSEAVKRVAGDIHVVRVPLSYTLPGETLSRVSGHCGIVRLPTADSPSPEILGVTSERWEPTNYPELAKALDRMDRSIYKIETAGLLSGGALCFTALRGEDWSVLQTDSMRSYFLVNLSLKPGVGHRVLHTSVRVVCNNTNEAALATSQIQLRIPHHADAAQEIGLCGDLLARFRKAQEETQRVFDAFASTPAPRESVNRIFAAAWPEPTLPGKLRLLQNVVGEEGAVAFRRTLDPRALQSLVDAEERHEKALVRVQELREGGVDRFEAFEPQELRGTVWAAYNAVTEVADWRGNGNDGKAAAESSLRGQRSSEKVRAFTEALDVIGWKS